MHAKGQNFYDVNETVMVRKQMTVKKRIFYNFIKRMTDILLSVTCLIFTSPILLFTAMAIVLEDGYPIFFCQMRIGKNGKPFKMIKLRSMQKNAESLLAELSEAEKKEFARNYKLKKDPRITRVGRFIRRTSIDELPQFWNVIRGDMSLVGPRPPLLAERESYGASLEKILSVRPGITGFWQVHGRSETNFSERIQMNEYYVEHRGIILDLKILLATIWVVCLGRGAR